MIDSKLADELRAMSREQRARREAEFAAMLRERIDSGEAKAIHINSVTTAWVDADVWERLSGWTRYRTGWGYVYRRRGGRWALLHVEVFGLLPSWAECVDHIDRDTLNNCRYNLRAATRQQNAMNCRRRNKAGLVGVGRVTRSTSYAVPSSCRNANSSKTYGTDVEAAIAYDLGVPLHLREFAYLNFPYGTPPGVSPVPVTRADAAEKRLGTHHGKPAKFISTTKQGRKWQPRAEVKIGGIDMYGTYVIHDDPNVIPFVVVNQACRLLRMVGRHAEAERIAREHGITECH